MSTISGTILDSLTTAERKALGKLFWAKVEKKGDDECWVIGKRDVLKAPGSFVVKGKSVPAVRVAYATTKGKLGDAEVVRHTCEHAGCVNPAHLILGAKEHGSSGVSWPKLNPVERVALMRKLAVERAKPKPKPWTQLAKDEGLPSRTLQYIYSTYEAERDTNEDPLGLIEETLLLYNQGIARLAEESENGDNSNARIGATRSMLSAAKGRLELLVAIGKVPSRLGIYAETRDLDRVFTDMGTVLEKHGAEPDLIRDLLTVIAGGEVAEKRMQLANTGSIEADFYEEDDDV